MKTASQLLRETEGLKNRLSSYSPLVGSNEAWTVQYQLQVVCGQLLVHWIEAALDQGVERDLWNLGFKNTIAQLQAQAKDKQGGSNEARNLLGWFLNSASGFYLQLFNQICSEYGLDLPFRRKDSIYGVVDLNASVQVKPKTCSQKNALYLCQYCLIHLGDLARYRHQAKHAETYYRHAVMVAPTSGHPYNQLALLEAGRGNRLAAVAFYVRAMCVPCPFPGAPANLTQTLTKVLASCRNRDLCGSSRVTGEEYTNMFLQCFAQLYLNGDATSAEEVLPVLCSALSTLVATNAFTRTSLIQMVVINLFALCYFLGKISIKIGEETGGNKDEEKESPKGHAGCLKVVEELTVGVLAALLLPVHTIRDADQLLTYPALPAIHLLFEWVQCEQGMLRSDAMKKKQQIWPGLCTLVNNLQQPLKTFSSFKYADVPLTEDWDLQGFEPLRMLLIKYKYRDYLSQPNPEEYNCLRASRLTDIAIWFTEQIIDGNAIIRVSEIGDALTFEPMIQNSSPPVDEVHTLEQLSLYQKSEDMPSTRGGKFGILKPQGSLERVRETRDQLDRSDGSEKLTSGNEEIEDEIEKGKHHQHLQLEIQTQQLHYQQHHQSQETNLNQQEQQQQQQVTGAGPSQAPRTRTNVALQAIMKRNSALQEAKQVTFRTPSPTVSPNPSEASSDSHRSQLSTPPLLTPTFQRDPLTTSPMPSHHGQMYQISLSLGHGNTIARQNHGNESNFSNSNQHFFEGPPAWGGVGLLNANLSTQSNVQSSLLQEQNPISNSTLNFKGHTNIGGPPQNILQQLQSSKNESDMSIGVFNQPSMGGFHQISGLVPPRLPDTSSQIREPGPVILERVGTSPPLPFRQPNSLSSNCRVRPSHPEAIGTDGAHMNQVSFRGQDQQDIDKNESQPNMNSAVHSAFAPSAINSHPYGMECRQNLSVTNSSSFPDPPQTVFGEKDVSSLKGSNLDWASKQNEGKNYPVSHPPFTPPPPHSLANLLQQHVHGQMRHGLLGDHGADQRSPGLARLSSDHSVHTSPLSPQSSPSIGSHSAVHLGMVPMPSSQTARPSPLSQMPRGQHFLQEGGESEDSSSNTYSLFSPMSGNSMGMGTGPRRTVTHPLYPSASQQSGGQQSLWSGPGPSPLERLLEQKKYSNVPK